MNESDASGLLCVGMHDTDGGQEPYATDCSKMNQDTSAIYPDHSNTSAFLEEYHMPGIQPLEELRFDNTQHLEFQLQKTVADSEDESVPSSPDTSSTTNYDMPGYMEQNLQHIYNAYDELVEKDGPVLLSPDFILCDETSHLEPHVTFSSDVIKIECLDSDSDKMITFNWGLSNIISISCKWAQSVGCALITLLVESEAENGNSAPVRVQFSLDDLQWPRKQQKIWHLETRYQEIWKDIPSDDFALENWSIEPSLFFPSQYFSNTEDFEDVVYPNGDRDAVSISKRDAELLLPETFVNDTIIDFYIKYLTTRIESIDKPRYHFFNSFFFRKLADLDKEQGRAPEGRAAFLRVRKWTRKINIFEKDFLFIPVNFSLHWSLIVVCYPGEVATFGDGAAKLGAKLPCILHMDSLKGSHSGLKDIIQSYLWEEWKERHPESEEDNSDKFLNLRFVSLELPQQDNSFDCGLFLLHYVEQFLMDVPTNFNPLKIDLFSGFLGGDWFPPAEASHKRSVIQKLIHEVVAGSIQDHPKLPCNNKQPDESYQSRNAEIEPPGELPARSCSSDHANGTQQPTSISLKDSEQNMLSASGGMLNTGMVSVVAVQSQQDSGVCLPENDTIVCLSRQDEKNETLVDMISCSAEDGEVHEGPSGVVSYMEHSESLHVTLDDNQKYSSKSEVKVEDIMVSNCCSISYNSDEVITYQEYSLQRNTVEVGQQCHMPAQDLDSLVMLDSSKGEIGPNPESMTAKDNDSDIGHMTGMGLATQGDINKNVADLKCEGNVADHITADDAIKDAVKETDTNADSINHSEQYVSSGLRDGNADNGMPFDTSQLDVGNTEKGVPCDNAISSGLNEGNTNQPIEGIFTYEADINADAVGEQLATSGAIHCEDAMDGAIPCEDATCSEAQNGTVHEGDTSCTDAEMPLVDRPCSIKNETVPESTSDAKTMLLDVCGEKDNIISDNKRTEKDDPENASSDAKRPLLDGIIEEKDITVSDDKYTEKDGICEEKYTAVSDDKCTQEGDNQGTVSERALLDGIREEDIVVSDDKCTEKDSSHGPVPDGVCDEKDIILSGDKNIQKDDFQVTDTESPLPDSLCEENVVSSDRCMRKDDAKRPLPDGMCEKGTAVPESPIQKDNSQSTEAKIERHYKRRKVLAAESQKERSSPGV